MCHAIVTQVRPQHHRRDTPLTSGRSKVYLIRPQAERQTGHVILALEICSAGKHRGTAIRKRPPPKLMLVQPVRQPRLLAGYKIHMAGCLRGLAAVSWGACGACSAYVRATPPMKRPRSLCLPRRSIASAKRHVIPQSCAEGCALVCKSNTAAARSCLARRPRYLARPTHSPVRRAPPGGSRSSCSC